MKMARGSGVILHISSLPGRYGIGNIGSPAREFVDFLADAGQRYWQFLPLGPTSDIAANSPYMSYSAFAGNPLFIDLEKLVDDGLVARTVLSSAPEFSEYQVDFRRVISFADQVLELAFQEFSRTGPSAEFVEFCRWINYGLLCFHRLFHGSNDNFSDSFSPDCFSLRMVTN